MLRNGCFSSLPLCEKAGDVTANLDGEDGCLGEDIGVMACLMSRQSSTGKQCGSQVHIDGSWRMVVGFLREVSVADSPSFAGSKKNFNPVVCR